MTKTLLDMQIKFIVVFGDIIIDISLNKQFKENKFIW